MMTRHLPRAYGPGAPLHRSAAHHQLVPGTLFVSGTPSLLLRTEHVAVDPSNRMTWTPGYELQFTDMPGSSPGRATGGIATAAGRFTVPTF